MRLVNREYFIIYAIMRHSIEFDWTLHIACNYRCAYCFFDGRWEDLNKHNVYPPLDAPLSFWKFVYERYGPSHIILSGGEPTIYPRFIELAHGLTSWHTLKFPSNISMPSAWWQNMARSVDLQRVEIQASFHPSQIELAPFIEKVRWMASIGYNLYIVIVAYPPHIPSLESWCNEIRASGLSVYVQPFHGVYQLHEYPHGYSHEERETIYNANRPGRGHNSVDDYRNMLDVAIGNQSPKGKPCTAGQLYCHISQSGDIYRCNMAMGLETRIGNIRDNFALYDQPLPCPSGHCLCESRWLLENRREG